MAVDGNVQNDTVPARWTLSQPNDMTNLNINSEKKRICDSTAHPDGSSEASSVPHVSVTFEKKEKIG